MSSNIKNIEKLLDQIRVKCNKDLLTKIIKKYELFELSVLGCDTIRCLIGRYCLNKGLKLKPITWIYEQYQSGFTMFNYTERDKSILAECIGRNIMDFELIVYLVIDKDSRDFVDNRILNMIERQIHTVDRSENIKLQTSSKDPSIEIDDNFDLLSNPQAVHHNRAAILERVKCLMEKHDVYIETCTNRSVCNYDMCTNNSPCQNKWGMMKGSYRVDPGKCKENTALVDGNGVRFYRSKCTLKNICRIAGCSNRNPCKTDWESKYDYASYK